LKALIPGRKEADARITEEKPIGKKIQQTHFQKSKLNDLEKRAKEERREA